MRANGGTPVRWLFAARYFALTVMSAECLSVFLDWFRIDPLPDAFDHLFAVAGLCGVLVAALMEWRLTGVRRSALAAARELANHRARDRAVAAEASVRRQRIQAVLDAPDQPAIVLQPIMRLTDRRAVGFEALSRFTSGSPEGWFAEAEEVGLGRELELRAIRQALSLLPAIPGSAYLSLNCSPGTLLSAELLELVRGSDPGRLLIELTEQIPIDDYLSYSQVIRELRRHGARIAVDDAGAGYASMRHIVNLRPEVIKLDRAFVQDLPDHPTCEMVAALLRFARSVGALVVAEGVETREQLIVLERLDVHYAQGYLLGRPQPVSDLTAEVVREPVPHALSLTLGGRGRASP
jgi:EAL domain-containing protein (putative c-di-GMP-specific phosphodiesterase class I)